MKAMASSPSAVIAPAAPFSLVPAWPLMGRDLRDLAGTVAPGRSRGIIRLSPTALKSRSGSASQELLLARVGALAQTRLAPLDCPRRVADGARDLRVRTTLSDHAVRLAAEFGDRAGRPERQHQRDAAAADGEVGAELLRRVVAHGLDQPVARLR